MNTQISRRAALQIIGGSTLASLASGAQVEVEAPKRTGMGLVLYCYGYRHRWMQKKRSKINLFAPMTFLKRCHSVGAGGMQAKLGVMSTVEIRELREFAERHELFIDAIIKAPTDQAELTRFTQELETAKAVGVQAVRTTIIPGRRYERFQTLAEFREFERRGREMLERAAPVVEKYRVPLAVENHKDQRIDERVALFKHLDSEFIGACVDTGNSFALLDGAIEPVEALAPYAFSVHLKDQALQEYEDGFLLADIPLGQGSFDLKKMVKAIKKVKPNVRFTLELITRDPLKVPCLTDQFYATMPEMRGIDLARTMRFVRQHAVKNLQYPSKLSLEEQVKLEEANVAASIKYAGTALEL